MTNLQNGAPVTQQTGAYNTYVGSRYVPLLTGQWDNTKNYEPLSIVINQGNSYTSAQYVPAGIPLQENGPYWFLTGNFNGQISQINQEINNLQDLTDNNTDDIEKINQKLAKEKLYVFFGDSYGTTYTGVTLPWTTLLANYLSLGSNNYITWCTGGVGFNVTNPELLAINRWNSFKEQYSEKLLDITDIIVAMGANDINHEENVETNAELFIQQVKNDCPNADIRIAMIGASMILGGRSSITLETLYQTASARKGVKYLNGIWKCFIRTNGCELNGVHPTQAGQLFLTYNLLNQILGQQGYNQVGTLNLAFVGENNVTGNILHSVNSNGEARIYGNINIPAEVTGRIGTITYNGVGNEYYIVTAGGIITISNGIASYGGNTAYSGNIIGVTIQ